MPYSKKAHFEWNHAGQIFVEQCKSVQDSHEPTYSVLLLQITGGREDGNICQGRFLDSFIIRSNVGQEVLAYGSSKVVFGGA